ncbi:hypothetical protein BH10BAC5_BH10BAC5_13320 [soil metagenome]
MRILYSVGFFVILIFVNGCKGQISSENKVQKNDSIPVKKIVGGGCDGCDIMYINLPAVLNSIDTSAGWYEQGEKLLVKGTVYKIDGKTPASGIIVYYYHTDNNGLYSQDEKTIGIRHGHIRGWVKTDENGKYALYTVRPAPYPTGGIPAHIHVIIKEANINEYYIDEFVFEGDKFLNDEFRSRAANRGGSGISNVTSLNGLQTIEHNIVLGQNIPDYPNK